MKKHVTRAYNSFQIDKTLATIFKYSKKDRLKNEINYYEQIQSFDASILFPRFLGRNFQDGLHELRLEYYGYDNLGDFMVQEKGDIRFWESVATQIQSAFTVLNKHTHKGSTDDLHAMYIDKTEREYQSLIDNFPKFQKISEYDTVYLNDVGYENFHIIWPHIKKMLSTYECNFNIVHGDFCFSNILCGFNTKTEFPILRFVDPRGSFGECDITGDRYYDHAKLMHSYEGGYEYFIYDEFEITENSSLQAFHLKYTNDHKNLIQTAFKNVFSKNIDWKNARLIQGLIFIGMCARHYDSLERQTAMYLTGIKILNEVLQQS